ncbi:carbohydrate ABC transporter permease [Paenibacillus thalictri]|uniref:Carbohydrate ABC transporter permease n=1 Tax=Paenibacillus thalictri TaxID=2527873 RepID=A0A4Q9DXY8_9BACL|nr:carbohydrate ABC transporter permease [Paenibacillus thalictri]TBL80120.1 carbohydrate ABC transporter permease [Paenibacillus thalictri]
MKTYITKLPVYLFVAVLSLFALIPFYTMIIMGTYVSEDLYTGLKLLPGHYFIENFKTVMSQNFLHFYGNSLLVSVVNTTLAVLVSALTGFAFAKYQFKGKKLLYYFVIATLMIPPQLGLIGFVVEMRWLGLVNTLYPLILGGLANAFGVFWMTQYISSAVPNEIIESGRLDGCSEMGIFIRIVFPVIRPAFITLFMLFFLWSWNNYLTPLVIINKEKLYTIPLAISLISSEYRTDYAARILALTLSTLPILILFAAGSKHLIRGLVGGSIKG